MYSDTIEGSGYRKISEIVFFEMSDLSESDTTVCLARISIM